MSEIHVDAPTLAPCFAHSEEVGELYAAIFAAQESMESPGITGKNDFTQKTYHTLSDILRAVAPALRRHGVLLMQFASGSPGDSVVVRTSENHVARNKKPKPAEPEKLEETHTLFAVNIQTKLHHVPSGQWMVITSTMIPPEPGAHAFTGMSTTLRRLALMALMLIPTPDDDGNSNSRTRNRGADRGKDQRRQQQPPASRKPPANQQAPKDDLAAKAKGQPSLVKRGGQYVSILGTAGGDLFDKPLTEINEKGIRYAISLVRDPRALQVWRSYLPGGERLQPPGPKAKTSAKPAQPGQVVLDMATPEERSTDPDWIGGGGEECT